MARSPSRVSGSVETRSGLRPDVARLVILSLEFFGEGVKGGEMERLDQDLYNMNMVSSKRYILWAQDVELHLISRDLLHTIQELCSEGTAPDPQTEIDNSRAIALMMRHMDRDLQFEFRNVDSAIKLWQALRERHGNLRDSILLNLEAEWNDLHFSDFDTVIQFYSEALRITGMMRFCGCGTAKR
ncbi:uncharacterized protein LOC133737544 [Rosa rugosa]|uniref:uncharacterized protein LOC133737544 n=1 Tax=Rosa rugosa TaxID=74645 RepID=UPI002B413343|nr:uncharacterized protein LOC133737544 [Rosa rugosa]